MARLDRAIHPEHHRRVHHLDHHINRAVNDRDKPDDHGAKADDDHHYQPVDTDDCARRHSNDIASHHSGPDKPATDDNGSGLDNDCSTNHRTTDDCSTDDGPAEHRPVESGVDEEHQSEVQPIRVGAIQQSKVGGPDRAHVATR